MAFGIVESMIFTLKTIIENPYNREPSPAGEGFVFMIKVQKRTKRD